MEAITSHLLPRQAANPGSNRNAGSNSLSGILSTLIPVAIVAAISVAVFLIVRSKYFKVYQPRTSDAILDQEGRRTPSTKASFFNTVANFKTLPDEYVLQHNSLDGYLYLRFFKLLTIISFVGCCITWPILFPVNATGGGGQSQLDILSFSNIVNPNRYYAHTFVAWIFLGFVVLAVARERMFYVGLRQAYFLSSLRAKRLTSRTVLFMNIPKDQQSVTALTQALGPEVRKVWMATDCKDLEESVKERNKAALKLEGAQVKLSKTANKKFLKEMQQANFAESERKAPQHWLDPKKKPTHRLKPLIGKKVETIPWAQKEIPVMTKKIEREQANHQEHKATIVSAAFVEFTSQAAAQRAYQLAAKSMKKSMQPRYIDVQPEEVIWKNLGISWASRKIKLIIASVIVALIIIFWTPIIAFIGALTNINSLTNKVPFLSFINDCPKVILGLITGLLPTIILAVCIILVPIICRLLAKLAGEPTLSAVELKTQSWYFAFQVVQVFLMTTFISGASAVTTRIIQNPASAPALLAENLPKASNFYMSYFILYGLAQAGAQLLMIVPLLLFIVLGKFLDTTPRKMYKRWLSLAGIGWGSEYPKWTNLGVIAISYSCIAPLVLGFATLGFLFLYVVFRYKWLFVFGNQIDMKGQAYSKALQQLLTGVYLSAICLIGLFAIKTAGNAASAGPLVLMIIFLIAAIVVQVGVNYALSPLEDSLPLDLVSDKAYDYEDSDETPAINDHEANGLKNGDVETGNAQKATGNKLTQRLRPYIDRQFFEPNRERQFELPEIKYEYANAYYNPAITDEEPFIWLARDECGISKIQVQENNAAGVASSDEFAWFDDKNQLHWRLESLGHVTSMLEKKESYEEQK